MIRYSLAELSKRKSGVALLPQMHGSAGAEADYLAALRVILRGLNKAVALDIVPVAQREIEAARRITRDVDEGLFEQLAMLGRALAATATQTVVRILTLESSRHTQKFLATAKRALGIDLALVVRQEDLAGYLENAALRSASLIKGLTDDTIRRVSQTVINSVLNGIPAKDLKRKLGEDFGFADSRAKLIARDQTAKVNSDLNRIRHTQAGITHYVWRTSHDERVRPRHKQLDGITYEYGKETGAEQGLPPGQPIQCRCIAQAIVEFGSPKPALTNGTRFIATEVIEQPTKPKRVANQRRLR